MSFFSPPPPNPVSTDPSTFRTRAINSWTWLSTTLLSEFDALYTLFTAAVAAMNTNDTRDASTSSVLIGTGTKVFTVSAGKSFSAGQWLTISNTPAPTNQMIGNVTSYSGTTLTVTVPSNGVFGSGTLAAWSIALTAAPSTQISAAMLPVAGAATLAAARSALDVPSISAVPSFSDVPNLNLLHNSNFPTNQRGVTGTVSLSAGVYGHDRWKAGASGCTYTFAESAGVTTITISAGSLVQVVEGRNLETATHTLSQSGTAQLRIVGGTYAASPITVSATSGANLSLEFGTGTVKTVKLEKGSLATKWQLPDQQDDLVKCQRFAVRLLDGTSQEAVGMSASTSSTSAMCLAMLPATLRATPTLSFLSGSVTNLAFGAPISGTVSSISSVSLDGAGKFIRINITGTGFTVGSSILRQNSGTPIMFISADL